MNQDAEIAGKYWIKNFLLLGSKIMDFVFPNTCAMCGKVIGFKELLCTDCNEKIFNNFPIMGIDKKTKHLDKIWAFARYDDIKELIIKYKFTPRIRLSKILSDALYRVYHLSPILSSFRYITFVPSTKSSKSQRGFDHVEKLVKYFSRISNTKILKFLKAVNKKPQIELDKKDRNLNVVGKYQIVRVDMIPEKLILIDDIMTTGSTMEECAKVLKSIGVKEIHGLVIAYNF